MFWGPQNSQFWGVRILSVVLRDQLTSGWEMERLWRYILPAKMGGIFQSAKLVWNSEITYSYCWWIRHPAKPSYKAYSFLNHPAKVFFLHLFTLPEINSSHLKMDGWNSRFLLGWPIFRRYVGFRGCKRFSGISMFGMGLFPMKPSRVNLPANLQGSSHFDRWHRQKKCSCACSWWNDLHTYEELM